MSYHRRPIYHVLPRFIVGLSPRDSSALMLPHVSQKYVESLKSSIFVGQKITDKSG